MPFIKLTKLEKRRVFTFLACLLFAIGAWLFLALKNKYIYTAKTVLIYKDFPQKRAFNPLQSDTVNLKVEGTGWQLLFSRLRINPQSIILSLNQLNTKNFIISSDQLSSINKQLDSRQKVISLIPDTLYFDFSKRTVKRVPIRLIRKVGFVKQFDLSSEIKMVPKFVTISGPLEELEKITDWPTDTLKIVGVSGNITKRIAMQHSTLKNVSIFPSSVQVTLPVDEFTEKTLEVPIKILNNYSYNNIKLYPNKVKVTFVVALSNFSQIDEDFIEASVDVQEWQNFGHSKLTVKVLQFPAYCKLVSIVPSKVDFLVDK
ncbi:YbbR-like domain-containing protein [Pedobacter changchengzhani]|uniref:YbbR-like domain-containing protein n=1 Tax=Pedobacter changchengzhani TaxID=2529274 RepID=A0A4R5MK68_9SPHI|nr:YbbR-like domain-containing protein [Pedobacter changchengzhani]TDG36040.1 YbbR-like domain-containing protein [Pedobacter changchengzhani]